MKSIVWLGTFLILTTGLVLALPASTTADQLLEKYYVIHKSLASDSLSGVAASAAEIAKISRQSAAKQPRLEKELTGIANAAAKLNSADLKSARNGFGELSERMIAFIKVSGGKAAPPYQFYCSMVKKNWLQPDTAVKNPYYGSEMPKCGELVKTENPSKTAPDLQGHHH